MNSNSLSIFCVSDVRVCVCVGETEPHSHIRATRKFVVIFFSVWLKVFWNFSSFPVVVVFCRSFYDDEVGGRLKVSFKSKMRLLVTCVTQGRDCLSLSGSLCFALFFFPPSPNSFYLLRVLPIASIPNPIFLTWPFSSCCFTPLG
jgi:hypothetical protein